MCTLYIVDVIVMCTLCESNKRQPICIMINTILIVGSSNSTWITMNVFITNNQCRGLKHPESQSQKVRSPHERTQYPHL
jgi:hypothetical protein